MLERTIILSVGSFVTGEEVKGYETVEELIENTLYDMEESHYKAGSAFIVPFIKYLAREHDDYCESNQEGGSEIRIFFEDDEKGFVKMIELIEKKFAKHLKSNLMKMELFDGCYLP